MNLTVSTITAEEKSIRLKSAVGTLVVHAIAFLLMILMLLLKPAEPQLIPIEWGGVGGGFGNSPQFSSEAAPAAREKAAESKKMKEKIALPEFEGSSEYTLPKPKKKAERKVEPTKQVLTSEVKSRKRASGSGTGEGGGIGARQGYSIDWGGVNSRKLLSGRVPVYPEGTDKEMPVVLRFSVLPDGSVTSIVPMKRSDELLESEAMSALRTWRFDPLPPQYEQQTQTGTVTFNFELE